MRGLRTVIGSIFVLHLECFELTMYQFRNVNMRTGNMAYSTIDALSAFWPGLQVLAGDVQNAIKSHLTCEFLGLMG